jgi:predicted ATPase/DNA-binding CsgD family transcriptional regulator
VAHNEIDNTYVESLTKREMEVLELLANGASNQEIAAALVVEVTTVKWYNAQIYGKLQVKNRKQAIMRAQTLGILKVNTNNPFQQILHNLPADTLPFIGRVREINELAQQLTNEKFRLITILGAGGMGKTRLAIEVGRELIPHFSDGVYFVPLAAIISTEQIVMTIAEIIGFKFHSDKLPKQQLLDYLHNLHLLLIIDNFEHLMESGGLLNDMLHSAPQTKVLATSREKLNLAGEVVHSLSGLSLPTDVNSAASADYDAVKLFVEAAQRTAIKINTDEMAVAARICQLLGGMPLAILLAAAWVDTLAIAAIEAEIKAGLGILEGNLRDAPTRHQSIQAAFETSWKRLSSHERRVFMCLSVFRDGFTRDAAAVVSGANVRDLQRLVHTSFIQLLPSGRYAIHELMRQYGAEKLKTAGELDSLQHKHAQFFAGFITPLGETSWGMASREILAEVNADFENVRAAWLFQAEKKNITELRRFLDGIWHFLDQYSRTQEGIELFEPLFTTFQDENDDVILFCGQLLARLAWFYSDTGHHQKALELAKHSLQIVHPFNATNDILFLYYLLYFVSVFIDRIQEAREYAEKGLDIARKIADSKWLVPFCGRMCLSYYALGSYEEAQRWAEALPVCGWRSTMMGAILMELGEYNQAEEHLLYAINNYHNHRIGHLQLYSSLIVWTTEAGNTEKAWRYVQRGLQYGDDGAYAWGTFGVFRAIMILLIAEQHYCPAVELLSLMLHHPAITEHNIVWVAPLEDTLKTNLSVDEFEAAWTRGKQLDLGDVITEYMER